MKKQEHARQTLSKQEEALQQEDVYKRQSENSLKLLAPDKKKQAILQPMEQIRNGIAAYKQEIVQYRHAPRFVPAGQSKMCIRDRLCAWLKAREWMSWVCSEVIPD